MKSTTILLVILMTFLLLIRLFFYHAEAEKYKEGQSVELTHSFLQEPRKNEYGQYFFISNILVSIPLYPKYSYGDKVNIKGTIEKQQNKKGEILILKNPKITNLPSDEPLLQLATYVRDKLEKSVLSTIPPKEGGLFLGIVIGAKDKIESEFYEDLRTAGVLHIIAASGQNVSILASILLITLASFVKRKQAILFTAVCILFYSILVGFDPPIVRASVMAIVSYGAMLLGRQSTGFFGLVITGWVMVVLSPSLMGDISFQLSFLATFGIITVKPILDSAIKFSHMVILKEDLTTTLSAQIATFPIMLASFGTYSLLSLPVNVLVLWTIPPLMLTGILSLFASSISPILGQPFVLIAYPFLYYFSLIIDAFSSFNFSIGAQTLPQELLIGYYLILIAILIKYRLRVGGTL